MRTTRLAITLAAVCVLAAAAVIFINVRPERDTPPPAPPQWLEAISATGHYVVDVPTTTLVMHAPAENGLQAHITRAETADATFTLTETPLQGTARRPLDEATDRTIEGAMETLSADTGAPVTVTEETRSTVEVAGAQARRVSCALSDGATTMTLAALTFYRDDALIQATVLGNAAQTDTDRFLQSVRPNE